MQDAMKGELSANAISPAKEKKPVCQEEQESEQNQKPEQENIAEANQEPQQEITKQPESEIKTE